jgi:[protein-PII] uridylyltransferase
MKTPPAPAVAPEAPLSALQNTLDQVLAGAAPVSAVSAAIKQVFVRARAAAAEVNRQQGGRAAGLLLSQACDGVLERLMKFAALRSGGAGDLAGLALMGLGSYGRCELAPYSDIDLMLLYKDGAPESVLENLVGHLLRPLWDAGLQIGHSVRCPQECLGAMQDAASGRSALETATSVLEARFVSGDADFAGSFLNRDLPEFFRKRGRAFVDAKFEETIKRWRGLTVHRTQPNLKESPGALRDFQLAMWIDHASQLSGHLPRLDDRPLVSKAAIDDAGAGYERLLTFRVALHSLCGRKQDVLDFQMQQAIAAELKYEPGDELKAPERLLRDYFRAATAVHRLAHTVTRRYLEERAIASRDIERLRRRRIDEDFTRVGDYLYASHDDLFAGPDWIEPAIRAFLHAARAGVSISQDMAEAIRARLPQMTDELRSHPQAAMHFRLLMKQRDNVASALRAMRDVGLLGSYMPEFGEIEGLVISDVFHDYTVDEHTLFVVEAVDRLFQSVESADRFRRNVLQNLVRPQLLRWACLLHDLGKSRGAPGHSQRGALMVPRICERLHMKAADVRALIFLVEEHLTLSSVSQRRDPGEGSLLKGLAEKCGTPDRLSLLFLLTYCDSISVGHGSYPLWKDALLSELYSGILPHFPAPAESQASAKAVIFEAQASSPGMLAEDSGGLESRLLAWARTDEERTLAAEHCRRVPRRYLVEVTFDEALSHLDLIRTLRAMRREAIAQVRGSGELVDFWMVSTDRPKRFSQICGAFLGAGVSVVSAIAYTRDDGLVIDHFRVAPGLDSASNSAGFWSKVAASVEDALIGKGDFLAKIESARKRMPRQPQVSLRGEPEVRVDNKLSEKFTVVDVICGDRIGLLYGLSRALADLSCSIHFAKIATTGGLATDVFYVTETSGEPVTDPEKMLNLKRLLKAVAADYQEARR